MDVSLLKPKLYKPPVQPARVLRPRLIERLNNNHYRKLALISAPAGFGKTTLLSDWVDQSVGPAAWLSLDEQDSDPKRFWTYMIASMQTVFPDLGHTTVNLLQAPQPPPVQTLLTPLLNELASFPKTLVMILDDYHLITSPQIQEGITFILEHQPHSLNLVISTRVDPPLPIYRLRARGRLVELRTEDLRFTLDEAVKFLNTVMGLDLSLDDVQALDARTEGWIVGLQLAALSLQGRPDAGEFIAAFRGSHHYVLEYLTEEVVRRQTKEIQRFLMQTSILDRLCGSLCDAVLEESGSSAALADLHRRNLFIVPLDDERRWYRYHHLFADLLRNLMRTEISAEQIRRLQIRASDWFAHNDKLDDAINHALRAQDFERAASLIEQNAQNLVSQGRLMAIIRWLEALPDTLLLCRPGLRFYYGWVLSLSGRVDEAIQILQDTRNTIQNLPQNDESRMFLGQLAAVLTGIASLREETAVVIQEANEALANLPQEDRISRARVYTALGAAFANGDSTEKAVKAWQQARELALEANNPFLAAVAIEMLAGTEIYYMGRLRAGARSLRQILEIGTPPDGRSLPFTGTAHALLAEIYLEQNNLDMAAQYLEKGFKLLKNAGISYSLIHTFCGQARLARAYNDPGEVKRALLRAEQAQGSYPMWHMALHLISCQVRLGLWLGDLELAARWAEGDATIFNWEMPQDLPVYLLEVQQISQARGYLARREHERVLKKLQGLDVQAQSAGRMAQAIDICILKALAWQAQGKMDAAIESSKRSLAWAEPEGYIRSFIEAGEDVILLLQRVISCGIKTPYTNRLLAAFGVE
ncbi:MAG: hypothetical protein JXA42_18975 [Anaerolineales bacterium]|nr:hypothetical protein [Anaerolineales bacterium]